MSRSPSPSLVMGGRREGGCKDQERERERKGIKKKRVYVTVVRLYPCACLSFVRAVLVVGSRFSSMFVTLRGRRGLRRRVAGDGEEEFRVFFAN